MFDNILEQIEDLNESFCSSFDTISSCGEFCIGPSLLSPTLAHTPDDLLLCSAESNSSCAENVKPSSWTSYLDQRKTISNTGDFHPYAEYRTSIRNDAPSTISLYPNTVKTKELCDANVSSLDQLISTIFLVIESDPKCSRNTFNPNGCIWETFVQSKNLKGIHSIFICVYDATPCLLHPSSDSQGVNISSLPNLNESHSKQDEIRKKHLPNCTQTLNLSDRKQHISLNCNDYVVVMSLSHATDRGAVQFFDRLRHSVHIAILKLELAFFYRKKPCIKVKPGSIRSRNRYGFVGRQNRRFFDEYTLGKKLGEGTFAKVYVGKHRTSGEYYAIKCISRLNLSDYEYESVLSEVAVQSSLNHPNIVAVHDFFEDNDSFYLVMELMRGGDLFNRIGTRESYSEEDAREICKNLLLAVQYCHINNVAHCDLKPLNMMLAEEKNDIKIKLADFGLSSRVICPNSITRICGSPYYVAPEVIMKRPYDQASDMWSVGIVIYLLLGGNVPFLDRDPSGVFQKIMIGKFRFPTKYWRNISEDAKNLIRGLLVLDPSDRMTAASALQSNWIQMDGKILAKTRLEESSRSLKKSNDSLTTIESNPVTIHEDCIKVKSQSTNIKVWALRILRRGRKGSQVAPLLR